MKESIGTEGADMAKALPCPECYAKRIVTVGDARVGFKAVCVGCGRESHSTLSSAMAIGDWNRTVVEITKQYVKNCPAKRCSSESWVHADHRGYWVQCGNCTLQGPICKEYKTAVKAWNERKWYGQQGGFEEVEDPVLEELKKLGAKMDKIIHWMSLLAGPKLE